MKSYKIFLSWNVKDEQASKLEQLLPFFQNGDFLSLEIEVSALDDAKLDEIANYLCELTGAPYFGFEELT